MQHQTFRGADTRDAMNAVRSALGPNAIIESARHFSNQRAGALGTAFVEITAAAPGSGHSPGPFARGLSSAASPQRSPLRALPRAPHPARETTPGQQDVALLHSEIVQLRAMLDSLYMSRMPHEQALATLRQMGVEGGLAFELARAAESVLPDALDAWLRRALEERMSTEADLLPRGGPQLIACVGPTGAGKTTTLAKLAARARLDHGRKVGVITLDTFRIGAVEQWQRYAELMGMPFAAAHGEDEFRAVLGRQNADVVLVDTAGRHGADGDATWQLPSCLRHRLHYRRNVLVVLPAWLGTSDAEVILRQYSRVEPTAAAFTKLDESGRAGGVLAATLSAHLPVAYLCDGPCVPEDIREASAEALLDFMFAAVR